MNSKLHWENIYKSKEIDGVSWFQETPTDSLNLIKRFSNNKKDKIIDVGCCLLYTSPSPRDRQKSRMPSSA